MNDDLTFEFYDTFIVINITLLNLLSGSTVDFVEDLMCSSFSIQNPNAV
ncbi:MAG: hypothetical protein LBS66_03695 [Rhodospirillaceae bacterium]|nr:hypothetical protein [Rhodospirillaceae bacterium]